MRSVLRFSLVFGLAMVLSTGLARAATTAEQLVALARAGLTDDILVALIQTDGSVFHLTADDILELHRQGLSDRVILAMQQTVLPAAPPDEDVIYTPPSPVAIAEPTAAEAGFYARPPVAVPPVARTSFRLFQTPGLSVMPVRAAEPAAVETTVTTEVLVPVAVSVPVPVRARGHVQDRAPASGKSNAVYWGWGGQRRPDSWSDGTAPPRRAPGHETHDAPTQAKDKGTRDR